MSLTICRLCEVMLQSCCMRHHLMTIASTLIPMHASAQAANHAHFRREGDDLHYDMHITLKEALLGFKKSVRHLDGRDVTIEYKGVTQPFQVRRMEGEGMPHHNYPSQLGVLHVKYIVDFPTTVNAEQTDVINRLFQ